MSSCLVLPARGLISSYEINCRNETHYYKYSGYRFYLNILIWTDVGLHAYYKSIIVVLVLRAADPCLVLTSISVFGQWRILLHFAACYSWLSKQNTMLILKTAILLNNMHVMYGIFYRHFIRLLFMLMGIRELTNSMENRNIISNVCK